MNKCDLCPYSVLKNGKLVCGYVFADIDSCALEHYPELRKKIYKILKKRG